MAEVAVLKDLIRSTFSGAAFPKGQPVAEHECGECDEIRAAFARQAPFELPTDVIEYHHDSLPMLSPTAFHHFLPAYLVRALDAPDSTVALFTWLSLSPDALDPFYQSRYDLFSQAEKAVVSHVVEFLIEAGKGELSTDERERARRYWRAA